MPAISRVAYIISTISTSCYGCAVDLNLNCGLRNQGVGCTFGFHACIEEEAEWDEGSDVKHSDDAVLEGFRNS